MASSACRARGAPRAEGRAFDHRGLEPQVPAQGALFVLRIRDLEKMRAGISRSAAPGFGNRAAPLKSIFSRRHLFALAEGRPRRQARLRFYLHRQHARRPGDDAAVDDAAAAPPRHADRRPALHGGRGALHSKPAARPTARATWRARRQISRWATPSARFAWRRAGGLAQIAGWCASRADLPRCRAPRSSSPPPHSSH